VNPPLDLVSLLKVADIVVGQPTTGLLEAMLVGKPVLFFSVMMSRDMTWWLQYGEINTIHEPSQLSPAILSLLQDPKKRSVIIRNQNEFLERFVGPVDGKASQRTIWLMKQIIKEKLHQDLDGWGN
jgi:predicted glycosyltransferase